MKENFEIVRKLAVPVLLAAILLVVVWVGMGQSQLLDVVGVGRPEIRAQAWGDYYKSVQEQLAMLISGTEEDSTAIPDRPMTLDGEPVSLGATATVTNVTGAAAINVDYAPGSAFWLESVTLNLSAAPTTSQNFTIVLDAGDGAAYDTTLYSGDLSVIGGGTTDLVYQPALEMLFESTDEIDVDFTNTDVVTYGLRVVVRLAE